MGAAMVPLMIGGGIVSAIGSYQGMEAKSANAAYQAQIARNNATIAERNANMDLQSGETAAVNRGLKLRAQAGAQLAAQGASGVDVNTGSAVNARKATAELGTLDVATIRSDTAKKVYADETQASNYQAQSGLLQQQSEEADDMAPVAALSSALSSASSLGGPYYKYMQST